ncbi:EF-hand domain-containing protein [Burkholderia plantarii]|uniref:EF-hand domain-containing protein n=1 Tax=Burkholderia plantarii TaxID=41899 RepID=UPI0018DB4893|nr:EF-hand domain-containing protein [Burkholderia plantarii]MBI0329155.1 EF-hand domain-containing protein [Burkholderia plantarii]
MSISSVGSASAGFAPANPASQPGASAAATSTAPAAASTASSNVTLSDNARAIAELNAKGVSVSTFSLGGASLPSGPAGFAALAKAIAAQAAGALDRPYDTASHQHTGSISAAAFSAAATSLGASATSADALFKALDTSGNGAISDAELYSALGATQSNPDSTVSQSLMQMMDTNGDGSVSQSEYITAEMRLTNAETSSTAT